MVLAWLRGSVACLSPRRPVFHPREICRGHSGTENFFFSPSNLIFPVSIIPTPLHAHLHVHVALFRRTNGQSLGNFQKEMLFRKQRNNGQKCTVTFPVQNLKYNAIGSVYDLVVAVNWLIGRLSSTSDAVLGSCML